ncbi:hypothetical protein CW304_13620 [Bacillus sp. UFRGS-B20]|nr:hypothetical protein CW304_13620 [Bacillus sp. UFRGS-B20]
MLQFSTFFSYHVRSISTKIGYALLNTHQNNCMFFLARYISSVRPRFCQLSGSVDIHLHTEVKVCFKCVSPSVVT